MLAGYAYRGHTSHGYTNHGYTDHGYTLLSVAVLRPNVTRRQPYVVQVLRAGPSSAAHTGGLTNLMATDADRIGKAESITWLLSQAAIVSISSHSKYSHSEHARRKVSRGSLFSQWTFSVLTLSLIHI